jgi:hypothetical protein
MCGSTVQKRVQMQSDEANALVPGDAGGKDH